MRCGRSEQAGDLKASNITPLLDWTTMSIRLTLPCTAGGLGFTQDVFEFVDLLRCSCKQEASLASGASLADRVKVDLHLFEFDTGIGELAIEVAVAVDLTSESPVIVVNKGVVEQSEID